MADRLVFNSEYNRDSFFQGAHALFDKMPDGTPKDLMQSLPVRSDVIPVPIRDELSSFASTQINRPVEILWNHRWEYDKQPQVFFAAIRRLISAGFKLSLHIVGQSFRQAPPCFAEFREAHSECILTWGFQPKESYHQILGRSDIVVSTALHDFQGLGMLEAIAAGCTPVAPNRMAYPEYIGDEHLYQISADPGVDNNEALEIESLFQKLVTTVQNTAEHPGPHKIDVQRYRVSELIPVYEKLIRHQLA